MVVCHCKGITDRTIRKAVRAGAGSRREVAEHCAASLGCGGCGPLVDEIIEGELEKAVSLSTFTELATAS